MTHSQRFKLSRSCFENLAPTHYPPSLLEWLEEEGEPDRLCEVERWLASYLRARRHFPATSTVRKHAHRCIERFRAARAAL